MKRFAHIAFITLLALTTCACNHIEDKAKALSSEVKEQAKKELKAQSRKVVDKVFPPFDYKFPDTEPNKARFKDFLKVPLTEDIQNIYCFDDAIGINASYMFSFNCSPTTSKNIIEEHQLGLDTLNNYNAFGLQEDFAWWDKNHIAQLQKYSWTDGNNYFKYYWYDAKTQKAYFFDFDL
ncbi:hypothetical protein [Mangrovimonas sp. TPBH4]|uniref:hypothetical protein n=1 Tax=Mangrovimonas sp. TPBH4 TaxID=1645914 RepID=UPI001E658FDF|nr:hypothetical protein [Mangrovimonas sp. TPBH4]